MIHATTQTPLTREQMIAMCSWWAGWCTDRDEMIPKLELLSGFLLEVKQQMALDRPEGEHP